MVSGSARVRAGGCFIKQRVVEVSRWVLDADPDEAVDTLLHETAHALAWSRHAHRGHGHKCAGVVQDATRDAFVPSFRVPEFA